MAKPVVTVVGDLMVDVSVDAGALTQGGDVRGRVLVRPGGAGANAAVWAAHAGARARLLGAVGDDLAGRLVAESLAERGVEAAATVVRGARTGSMLVVREQGVRSMVADRGASSRLSPADLPERIRADAVLVSGYLLFDGGSEEAARACLARADAPLVAVEAASWPLLQGFGPDRFIEATAGANVLLANQEEAEVLAPEGTAALGGHYRHVALKRGRDGAYLGIGGRWIYAASPAVEDPADTTGAGDAFDGVLLACLARGTEPGEALRRACAAGGAVAASGESWPER